MSEGIDINDIRVKLAEVNGKLDLITAKMEAGDRNTEQLIALVKDQLGYHAADLGLVKAELREDRDRAAHGLSAVRVDLENRILPLEKWQSQLRGVAFVLPPVTAVLTGAAIKFIGG